MISGVQWLPATICQLAHLPGVANKPNFSSFLLLPFKKSERTSCPDVHSLFSLASSESISAAVAERLLVDHGTQLS